MNKCYSITVLLIFLLLCCPAHLSALTYTVDNTTDFCNPERGLYQMISVHIKSSTTTSNLSDSYFTSSRSANRTLLMRLYYLDGYRDKDLDQNALNLIAADFAKFRSKGCKCILRIAYDETGQNDASLAIWQRHLDQLQPILTANADVIYVVQAGFLGQWGEWYYSSYGTGSKISSQVKTSLLDKLLACVPASRCVQVRTPKFKEDYVGTTTAMTSADAYQNTAKGRIGHHNDAFLNGSTNCGTYTNRSVDMAYLGQECLYVPNGGETNDEDDDYPTYNVSSAARTELQQLHYSYLNYEYAPAVIAKWKKDGFYSELSRNLGYRFQLLSSSLPSTGSSGGNINVQLTIKNVGYAPLYNERKAYIVFKSSSNTYSVALASNPRSWQPNGAQTVINELITLPSDMAAGTYSMYLWLPDASPSIASDSKFAVRFANTGLWDGTTGYNSLQSTITVSGGAPTPGPVPSANVDAISNFAAAAQGPSSVKLSWTNPAGTSAPSTEPLAATAATLFKTAGSCTLTVSGNNMQVAFTNVNDWEVAGVQFTLDQRTDIQSVSYTLKGDGSATDFIAYVQDSQGAMWYESGKSLAATTATNYSFTPKQALWCTPAHSYGTYPLTSVLFVANPDPDVTMSGSFTLSNVVLHLTGGGTVPAKFTAVKIVRKQGAYPTSLDDGTVVYNGASTSYTDTDLAANTQYFYAAYSFNGTDSYSSTIRQASATTTYSTALDVPTEDKPIRKVLINGHLYIITANQLYTIYGLTR